MMNAAMVISAVAEWRKTVMGSSQWISRGTLSGNHMMIPVTSRMKVQKNMTHQNCFCPALKRSAEEHDPPELLLSCVEARLRRHGFIVMRGVSFYVLAPLLILWNGLHVALPLAVHPEDGEEIDQSNPGMQQTHEARTAHHIRQPVKDRRK